MWSGVEEGKGSKLHLFNSHYGLCLSNILLQHVMGGGVREMKTKAPAITYTGTQV